MRDAGSGAGELVRLLRGSSARYMQCPLFCPRAALAILTPHPQVRRKIGPTSGGDRRSRPQGPEGSLRVAGRPATDLGSNPSVPEELAAGVGPWANVLISPNLRFFSGQTARAEEEEGWGGRHPRRGLSGQLTSLARKLAARMVGGSHPWLGHLTPGWSWASSVSRTNRRDPAKRVGGQRM